MNGFDVRILTDYMTEHKDAIGRAVGDDHGWALVEFGGSEHRHWFAPSEFELVRPAKDMTLSAWVARADDVK
jgi:hypothetical protein